jgi:hypothetical protein
MKLANTDLSQTSCPNGLVIDFQGLGKQPVNIPCRNLLHAVAVAYAFKTLKLVNPNSAFLQRIEVIDYDEHGKLLQVYIGPK